MIFVDFVLAVGLISYANFCLCHATSESGKNCRCPINLYRCPSLNGTCTVNTEIGCLTSGTLCCQEVCTYTCLKKSKLICED